MILSKIRGKKKKKKNQLLYLLFSQKPIIGLNYYPKIFLKKRKASVWHSLKRGVRQGCTFSSQITCPWHLCNPFWSPFKRIMASSCHHCQLKQIKLTTEAVYMCTSPAAITVLIEWTQILQFNLYFAVVSVGLHLFCTHTHYGLSIITFLEYKRQFSHESLRGPK